MKFQGLRQGPCPLQPAGSPHQCTHKGETDISPQEILSSQAQDFGDKSKAGSWSSGQCHGALYVLFLLDASAYIIVQRST